MVFTLLNLELNVKYTDIRGGSLRACVIFLQCGQYDSSEQYIVC